MPSSISSERSRASTLFTPPRPSYCSPKLRVHGRKASTSDVSPLSFANRSLDLKSKFSPYTASPTSGTETPSPAITHVSHFRSNPFSNTDGASPAATGMTSFDVSPLSQVSQKQINQSPCPKSRSSKPWFIHYHHTTPEPCKNSCSPASSLSSPQASRYQIMSGFYDSDEEEIDSNLSNSLYSKLRIGSRQIRFRPANQDGSVLSVTGSLSPNRFGTTTGLLDSPSLFRSPSSTSRASLASSDASIDFEMISPPHNQKIAPKPLKIVEIAALRTGLSLQVSSLPPTKEVKANRLRSCSCGEKPSVRTATAHPPQRGATLSLFNKPAKASTESGSIPFNKSSDHRSIKQSPVETCINQSENPRLSKPLLSYDPLRRPKHGSVLSMQSGLTSTDVSTRDRTKRPIELIHNRPKRRSTSSDASSDFKHGQEETSVLFELLKQEGDITWESSSPSKMKVRRRRSSSNLGTLPPRRPPPPPDFLPSIPNKQAPSSLPFGNEAPEATPDRSKQPNSTRTRDAIPLTQPTEPFEALAIKVQGISAVSRNNFATSTPPHFAQNTLVELVVGGPKYLTSLATLLKLDHLSYLAAFVERQILLVHNPQNVTAANGQVDTAATTQEVSDVRSFDTMTTCSSQTASIDQDEPDSSQCEVPESIPSPCTLAFDSILGPLLDDQNATHTHGSASRLVTTKLIDLCPLDVCSEENDEASCEKPTTVSPRPTSTSTCTSTCTITTTTSAKTSTTATTTTPTSTAAKVDDPESKSHRLMMMAARESSSFSLQPADTPMVSLFLDRNPKPYPALLDTLRTGKLPVYITAEFDHHFQDPFTSCCSSSDNDDHKDLHKCKSTRRLTLLTKLEQLKSEAAWLGYSTIVKLCQVEVNKLLKVKS